jgi:tetratricopeptide (TPR) repeat protein
MSFEHMKVIASALFGYFRIMLYPMDLNIEYVTVPLPLLSFKAVAAASLMILLMYAAFRKDTDDLLRLAAVWLVLSFLPISNIIPLPSAVVADRFLYMPLLGMSLAVGYGVKWLYVRRRLVTMAAFSIFIMMAGTLTYERNYAWQSPESLWMDVVKKSPGKAVGYYNLGIIYGDRGLTDKAEQQYLRALQREPDYAPAHINLGIIYQSQGNIDTAIKEFETAVTLKPDFAKARYNLGLAYHSQGLLDMATEQYSIAINISPDYAEAHNNLGSAYRAQGNMTEAIRHYRTAVKINPASANAHNNLGSVYMNKGLIDEAIQHFQAALAVEAGHAKARSNLNMATALRAYSIQQQEMMRQQQDPQQ